MGYNKTTYTNPEDFVAALRSTTKVKFENAIMKAETSRIQEKNSKRETRIEYFWKPNGSWQSFSYFAHHCTSSVIEDFFYQCKIFGL